jgi:thiol-disulfide isomerase/thioredoxin
VDFLVLISIVLLVAVFASSASAKLLGWRTTVESLTDFGVPARISAPSSALLISAEYAIAATLIPSATASWAALAAAGLLALFTVALATQLLRGKRPRCRCFGALSAKAIGWSDVARNLLLGGLAVFVALHPRAVGFGSLVGIFSRLSTEQRLWIGLGLANLALLAAIAALLVQVVRQQGRMLLRFDVLEQRLEGGPPELSSTPPAGLPLGMPAPEFTTSQLGGGSATLAGLLANEKPALLVFSNPDCGPCQALFPEVAGWQRDLAGTLTVAIVSEGSASANRAKISVHGVERLLLQTGREVAERYEAYGTPAAVFVSADGRIAAPLAQGAQEIRELVDAVRAGRLPALPTLASSLRVGEPAPELAFKTLAGEGVALSELRGQATLLVFWNLRCGFCEQMLPALRAWEAAPPPGAPRLVLISSGSADDHRALDLRAPILLETELRAADAFGVHGTPMALLLDADGRVASQVAAGAQAVLALANRSAHSDHNGRVAAVVS